MSVLQSPTTRPTADPPGGRVHAPPARRRHLALTWTLLALATLAAHGASLRDGLWLDDHWHARSLRDRGWTPRDLLETTTIDLAQQISTWWQDRPVVWQYARPFSVLLMKIVYVLSAGNPLGHHAAGLLLHFLTALLVHRLALWLTARPFWSGVAALLFILYPLSPFAVSWPAAQNILLQTALMLAALLCYLRASGLDLRIDRPPPRDHPLDPPPLHRPSFLVALLLWTLALLSRENAVVFPALALAFDLAFGGRRLLRARWPVYLLLALIASAYLLWRLRFFYVPFPDVYLRRPDGDAYLAWWLAKLLHYLACSVWIAPMSVGPTGRFFPWREAPFDCALLLLIVFAVTTGYLLLCRRARGFWLWPLWIFLCLLPSVPIIAMPHTAYPCAVAFALAMILVPTAPAPAPPARRARLRAALPLMTIVSFAAIFPIHRLFWMGSVLAERFTLTRITREPPPAGATDLFFINLPFANVYIRTCLAEHWGPAADNLRCHALLFAPEAERMKQHCVVEQLDAHRFRVRTDDRPYFSGLLGRFLLTGMAGRGQLTAGESFATDLYEARILSADDRGVREIQFTFSRPLTDPRFRFYVSTFAAGTAQLQFTAAAEPACTDALPPSAPTTPTADGVARAAGALRAGEAAAGLLLLDALRDADPSLRAAAHAAFLSVARPVARALCRPEQHLLEQHDLTPADLACLRTWWRSVDDQAVADYYLRRDEFFEVAHQRDELERCRAFGRRMLRTDLYLTGPPFPGPQRNRTRPTEPSARGSSTR